MFVTDLQIRRMRLEGELCFLVGSDNLDLRWVFSTGDAHVSFPMCTSKTVEQDYCCACSRPILVVGEMSLDIIGVQRWVKCFVGGSREWCQRFSNFPLR